MEGAAVGGLVIWLAYRMGRGVVKSIVRGG